MPTFCLIFLVGIFAGIVSGMIGSGSGLILVPVQLLLGIDPKIATTTTHFGFIGVSLGSLARFKKEGAIKTQHILPLLIIACFSGIIGPYLLFAVQDRDFQKIVGLLILLCAPLFFMKKNMGAPHQKSSIGMQVLGYIALCIIFTLQVAFGTATGILAIFVCVYFLGLSMIETSAILRFPHFLSSTIALVIYALHGEVHYAYGAALFLAMIIGGYIGSHIAITGGEKFVKYAFTGFACVVAALLLYS